jgi:hypothetical protein
VEAAYISPLILPPGGAKVIPLPKVAFWFQADLRTASMTVVDESNIFEVDMTDGLPKIITYDASGNWSNNSGKKIHYIN